MYSTNFYLINNKSKDSFYTKQIIISNGQSKSQHISLKLTKEYYILQLTEVKLHNAKNRIKIKKIITSYKFRLPD